MTPEEARRAKLTPRERKREDQRNRILGYEYERTEGHKNTTNDSWTSTFIVVVVIGGLLTGCTYSGIFTGFGGY